jgi:hypothetical protein
MTWNDSSTITANYNLAGLRPSVFYDLYNNSIIFDKKKTDLSGNIQFSVSLASEHEIKVQTDPQPPRYWDNSTSSPYATQPVEHRLRWTDNSGLSGYVFSFDNCRGSFENDTWVSWGLRNTTIFEDGFEIDITTNWTATGGWNRENTGGVGGVKEGTWDAKLPKSTSGTLTSKSIDTTGANKIYVDFWVQDDDVDPEDNVYLQFNDSTGNWDNILNLDQTTEDAWINIVQVTTDLQYFHPGFAIRINAPTALAATENFWVDAFKIMKESPPAEAWSNVTKTINETVGCTVRWKVHANDTYNNWNTSLEYSYETLPYYGWLNATLHVPDPDVCTDSSPCLKNQYRTFDVNASVRCEGPGIVCGSVSGSVRYNRTALPDWLINTTEDTPFYLVGGGEPDSNWYNATKETNNPPKRERHAIAYDSTRDKVLIFGGYDGTNRFNDTWIYNFTDGKWYNATKPGSPSIREMKPAMAYDSYNDKIVLFGGFDGSSRLGDTWLFNMSDEKWYSVTPPSSPPKRGYADMVYDSEHKVMVLFGGSDVIGSLVVYQDTWIYNVTSNTWTNVTNSSRVPSKREEHAMAYDSLNKKVILFGGYDGSDTYNMNDTWEFNWTDKGWYEINIPVDKRPQRRRNHEMVYDSESERIIMFGGLIYPVVTMNDTWVFNYTDKRWYNITPELETIPPDVQMHKMAYVSKHDLVFLFGGETEPEVVRLHETWLLNYTAGGKGANPRSCGSLDQNQSCQLIWSVNTTGVPGKAYKIDVNFSSSYSKIEPNKTKYAVVSINRPPRIWNLVVRDTMGNPIDWTGTGVVVNITVNVSDENLDYVEGKFTWPNGTEVYENLTYHPTNNYTHNWTYTIPWSMPPGVANITVTAYDIPGLFNSTNTTLIINETYTLDLINTPINFSTVSPGRIVNASSGEGWPLLVVVTGNVPVNLSQRGEPYLTGLIDSTERIGINNITWNTSASGLFSELSSSYYLLVNKSLQPGYDQPIYYKLNVPSVKPQRYGGLVYICGKKDGVCSV